MVMETPSPKSVGREFVRQYYTLMNEAPNFLHRFYSHDSSFVHGGVEKPGEELEPVVGQKEIHEKIMTLNLDNCHANIRQVDSQATVGPAVVVQVTGELSNNGQPMRRFMQTFVLVSQSFKHYYVHNDIFRYQDEVFHDNDTETEPEVADDAIDSEPELADAGFKPDVIPEPPASTSPSQQQASYFETQEAVSPPPQLPQQPPLSNGGGMHEEERSVSPSAHSGDEEEEKLEDAESGGQVEAEAVEEEEPVSAPQPEPKAPFSWAMLASKPAGPTNAAAPPMKQPPQPVMTSAPQPQRAPRTNVGVDRPPASRPPMENNEEPRKHPAYANDQHQLFVGSIPNSCSDRQLKNCLEEYGTVLQVRMNRRSSNPHGLIFAFVTFEEVSTVQKILENRPIMLKMDGQEYQLNVQAKQDKKQNRMGGPRGGRGGGGMGRGGMDGRGGRMNMGGGPRR